MEVIILTFILSLCGLQASAQIDLSKCGNTLGCIRLPASCSASACDAIVTHQLNNGTLTFQFATTHNWIGFGQKSDRIGMANLRGQYCARGISVPFGSFVASRNGEPDWRRLVDGVVLVDRTEKDNLLTCTFTRPLVPSNLSKAALYNLNVSDMVGFIAYGNNNGRDTFPNKHLDTSVTSGAVDFLSTDSPTTATTTTPVAMTTPMTNATMSTTPRITPMTEMITIDISKCGNTLGCIRRPPSCSASSCDAIITYRHNNGTLTFQFATKHNWIGFGQKSAADGRAMAKLRGQYCARGISAPFGSFNASGNSEPNWMEVVDGVVLINRTEIDGLLTCTFTRPLVPSILSKDTLYNLNVSDMVGFIAYGDNNGRDTYPNKHLDTSVTNGAVDFLSTDSPATAATPTPVVMTTSSREMSTIDLSKCGETLGCVRHPQGCPVSGCDAIVTYQLNKDVLTFQLATKHKWIGFGQKPGGSGGMANLRGQYCANGISVPFGSYVASVNDVPDWSNTVDGVSLIDRGVKDGLLICTFTRPLVPSNLNQGSLHNLNMSNMFGFLAYGNNIGSTYPNKHDTTRITKGAINFSISANSKSEGGRNANSTVKLHAILMILAWVLFATIGIFMAHFMKPATQNKKIAGKQAWFPFHVLLMFLCVISFIAGLIIILTKYNKIDKKNKHHMLGLFTVIAGLIQPVMAFFRPGPDHDRRFIFNWAHRLVGMLAWCLGAAAIIYGFEFFKEANPKIEEGVMLTFIFSVVGIFIVLNLILLLVRRDSNDSVSYGKRSGVVEISKPQKQQERSHAVEWIFLLIIIGFSVAMAAYHVYRVVDLREASS